MVFHRPTGDCRSAAYEAAAGNPANASENKASVAVKMDAFMNNLPSAVCVGAESCSAFYRKRMVALTGSARSAVEPRLLRKIAAPQIQSEQRSGAGAHGMRLVACMLNQRSRSMF